MATARGRCRRGRPSPATAPRRCCGASRSTRAGPAATSWRWSACWPASRAGWPRAAAGGCVPTRGRGRADVRAQLPARAAHVRRARLAWPAATRAVRRAAPRVPAATPAARWTRTAASCCRSCSRCAARCPRAEVFAFNTELVHLTRSLAPGKIRLTLERLAAAGARLVGGHAHRRVPRGVRARATWRGGRTGRTVVVILSDGLDRGEPGAARRGRARDPAAGRAQADLAEPAAGRPALRARGRAACGRRCPFVDHFASAHDLESLERLASPPGGLSMALRFEHVVRGQGAASRACGTT